MNPDLRWRSKKLVMVLAACVLSVLSVWPEAVQSESASGGTSCDVRVASRYLHFPVAPADQDRVNVRLLSHGEVVRYFDVDIAEHGTEPLFWASVEVARWFGQTLQVECESPSILSAVMAVVEQDDTFRPPVGLYDEPRRPQFHFSPAVGWTNDPNGLTYLDGEYHLFFQHNPYGINWGNMTWGHAVSTDLVHWEEIGDALRPDALGTVYSGSGVVDHNNTSRLQNGSAPPLVVFFTSAGSHSYRKMPYTQSMAYSIDRGRTWTKYASNPVIGHIQGSNRDPKVLWHEPSRRWIMALYLDRGKFRLFRSENLKEWEESSDVDFPDGHECPELFELPVDGDPSNTRWVMWEGGGRHMIGRFDGQRFTAETEVLPSEWGANCYAAQTWNHVPDGRRVLIGWMRYAPDDREVSVYQGMPFNQQMTFPRQLSLRSTPDGVRLFAQPASEIEKLYRRRHVFESRRLVPGEDPLREIHGELFDIEADLFAGDATSIEIGIGGTPIVYDARTHQLTFLGKSVTLDERAGRLQLRILVDRTSVEIFAAGGRYVMSFCFRPDPAMKALSLRASGGAARIRSLHVRELRSIWRRVTH